MTAIASHTVIPRRMHGRMYRLSTRRETLAARDLMRESPMRSPRAKGRQVWVLVAEVMGALEP